LALMKSDPRRELFDFGDLYFLVIFFPAAHFVPVMTCYSGALRSHPIPDSILCGHQHG
jgi:hypothetical protein